MKNTVKISTTFSFKGETFKPSTIIDLDLLVFGDAEPPNLHNHLATKTGIDNYSYAYEVMQQSAIRFSDATGLACDCLSDDEFDFLLFLNKRHDHELLILLQNIARDTLNIGNLANKPDIKDALQQAYQLGQQQGR